jgi:predicted acylesterase/phospholipase RssA
MESENKPKPDAVPIQVVFQGGGAKLCVLMAVCDVLRKYQAVNRIQINRVAGSSAGAIAAAMLATEKSIETYIADLKSIGPRYLADMKTWRWRGGLRVFNGKAYFIDLNLESFFEELFGTGKRVTDLKPEAQLYFTDLYSLEARTAPSDEPLAKALAKSCRFPFAFVGYGTGNTEVDGGLALNLPVDRLKNEESEKGSVIGISFSSRFGAPKNNLLSYTQQLFSAAIQSSVARSETILGKQNVFPIDTEIGTFDFNEALTNGFGIHYKSTTLQFQTWLDSWLHSFGPMVPEKPEKASRLIRPPLSNVPLPVAVVRDIDARLKSEPPTSAKSIKSYETAVLDDRGRFTGRYMVKTIMTFSVSRPINTMQFDFEIGRGGLFTASTLGCAAVNRNGYALRFVPHVQELTKPEDRLRSFRVYFLFDQQLTPASPDQPYVVEYQCEADDPYTEFAERRGVGSMFFRTQGDAEEMSHAVAFPRSKFDATPRVLDIATVPPERLKELDCELEKDEALIVSEEIELTELIQSMDLHRPVQEYFLVGRRVRNIRQGQGFGFVIE